MGEAEEVGSGRRREIGKERSARSSHGCCIAPNCSSMYEYRFFLWIRPVDGEGRERDNMHGLPHRPIAQRDATRRTAPIFCPPANNNALQIGFLRAIVIDHPSADKARRRLFSPLLPSCYLLTPYLSPSPTRSTAHGSSIFAYAQLRCS